MTHPLAAAVQPLIDQWLASDEGVIAEMEFELAEVAAA